MPASIIWDLIKPGDISDSYNGMRITRGLMVKGLAPVINPTYGTDPGLLARCWGVSGFPQLFESFPDPKYSYLTVRERRLIDVINKSYTVRFAVVYEGFNEVLEPTWVVHEDFNVSFIQTSATARGSSTLNTFYRRATSAQPIDANGSPPNGATVQPGRVHKMRSGQVIRAIANMSTVYYQTNLRQKFLSVAAMINMDNWNGYTRGQVYFVGPKTTTRNAGTVTQAVLDFIVEPRGHYPVLAWFDLHGRHPKDCDTEAYLRAAGLPAVDNLRRVNGLSLCSVQDEGVFTSVFPFVAQAQQRFITQ